MEGRAILAVPARATGRRRPAHALRVDAGTALDACPARALLDLPFDRLRVITPHVGGGFGGKAVGGVAAYVIARRGRAATRTRRCATSSRAPTTSRPCRDAGCTSTWRCTRVRDGTIVGLDVDECCDAGAYPAAGSIEPGKTSLMACGPYRVPAVAFRARSVRTNLAPTGAYRGPGRVGGGRRARAHPRPARA